MRELGKILPGGGCTSRSVVRFFALTSVFVALFVSVFSFTRVGTPEHAYAATSSNLNYQARLLSANGNIVPDGLYNIEFKLYDANSGGTALWTERYHDSNGVTAGNDNRVRIVNGYLSVNLASVTAFPTNINWDQDMWLTMNIGGSSQVASPAFDGEMNPRIKLTAVPYAFQAKQATKLVQNQGTYSGTLDFNTLTGNRTIMAPDESGTLCLQGSANCGFAGATGATGYIQNGTAVQTANFNIQGASAGSVVAEIRAHASSAESLAVFQIRKTTGSQSFWVQASGTTYANGALVVSNSAYNSKTSLVVENVGDGTRNTAAFRGATGQTADILRVTDASLADLFTVSATGQLKVASATSYSGALNVGTNTTAASGGIYFGTDTNLYRSAANTLKTDGSLVVGTSTGSGMLSVVGINGTISTNNTGETLSFSRNSLNYVRAMGSASVLSLSAGGGVNNIAIGNNGQTTLRNHTNSLNAFTVQGAGGNGNYSSGATLLNVNTLNSAANFGQYQNLLRYSEQFDNATWGKTSNVNSVVADNALAPNGTMTADQVDLAGGYNPNSVSQPIAANVPGTYTYSIWLRSVTGTASIALIVRDSASSAPGGSTTINISPTTTWARYSVTGLISSGLVTGNFGSGTAGNESVYVWGAQLEESSVAGPYVPTGSAAVGANSQGLALGLGDITARNASNSANAFQIQNAAGSTIFNVNTLSGAATLSGNLTVSGSGTFNGIINTGYTLNTAGTISDVATDGPIGTAENTVDRYTTININQTTGGRSLTLPAPTNTTAGRIVYVNNVGATPFMLYTKSVATGNGSVTFVWNGSAWATTDSNVGSGSGTNLIGVIDSQGKSANGAIISGSTLYLQTADASNVGLVSASTQTFGGDKTFNGKVTFAAAGTGLQVDNNAVIAGSLSLGASGASGAKLYINTGAIGAKINVSSALDILQLQSAGTNVFTVSSTGSTILKNTTNSSVAFNIQNAAGVTVFNVNTSDGQAYVGTPVSGSKFSIGAAGEVGLAVKQTGAFDILQLQNSSGTVLKVDSAGATSVTTSGTAAFKVGAASGTTNQQNTIVADTVNGNVGIGKAPVAGSGVLQVEGYTNINGGLGLSGDVTLYGTQGNYSINKQQVTGTGGVAVGDVVVMVTENSSARVVTTTTPRDSRVYGVARQAQATVNAGVPVAIAGNTSVNVDTSAVAIGDQLVTSATAGRAMTDNNATTGVIGYATSAKAAGSVGSVGITVKPVNGQASPYFRSNDFRIQDATGTTTMLQVDGANSRLAIGPGAVPANGALTIGTNTTGAANGLYFGTDTNLYRQGASLLQTNSSFIIDGTGGTYCSSASSKFCVTTSGIGATLNVTSTNNILQLQNSGTNVLTVNSNGDMLLRSLANSSAALRVNDNGGVSVLNVNTANRTVSVGDAVSGKKLSVVTAGGGVGLYVSNSTDGTGNLLELYGNNGTTSAAAVTVGASGATNFKNNVDSTTALTVQNAAGTNLMVVDTTNGRIGINRLPNGGSESLQVSGSISTTGYTASNLFYASDGLYYTSATQNAGRINKKINIVSGSMVSGDVVIIDDTANIVTTTAARDGRVYGVANNITGATAYAAVSGFINVNATDAAVNIGDQLVTSTEAGKVMVDNNATTGILGYATSAKAAGAAGVVGVRLQIISGQNAPTFRNGIDTTTAFQIQNAAGVSLFTADTTNGRVAVGPNAVPANGVLTVGTNTITGSGGMYFGTDTNLFRHAASQLRTNGMFMADGAMFARFGSNSQVSIGYTGLGVVGAGVAFGNNADVSIYRSAADVLQTDDSFVINGSSSNLTVGGAATVAGNLTVGANSSLILTGGASFPSSPVEGQLYFNTATKQMYLYTNGAWQAQRSTIATKVVSDASTSQNPERADYQVPAGATNAQVTINAAIAALPAGGGSIYLTEGTFIIDDQITLPSNVTLTGAGVSSIIKLKDNIGNTGNLYAINTIGTVTNVIVSNLTMDGNRSNNAAAAYQAGIGGTYGSSASSGITITGLQLKNFKNENISVGGTASTITGNTITGASGYGLSASGSNYVISNNQINGNGTRGMNLGGGGSHIITGNKFHNNASSSSTIYLNDSDNNTIIGNDITDTTGTGYAIDISSSLSSNNYLASNRYSGTGATSINDLGTGTIYGSQIDGTNSIRMGSSGTSGFFQSSTTANTNATLVARLQGAQAAELFSAQDSTGNRLVSIDSTGKILFGTSGDVNIYRSAANTLQTDNALLVRTATNTSAALSVQDSSGATIFNVNSTTRTVGVGVGATNTDKLYVASGLNVITANQSGTNNILQLQNNGTNVFTVGADGRTLLKNSTDSTMAFAVQTTAGINTLQVDTATQKVFFSASNGISATINAGTGQLYLGGATSGAKLNVITSGVGAVINTTGAFDNLQLQNNGTNVLTVGSTGNTLFKNSTDSTTALQVQNAAGNLVFAVDTTNQTVGIGQNAGANGKLTVATGSYVGLVVNALATQDIMRLQSSSTNVLTVGSTGNALFRNATDSAAAFNVQNAGGEALISVDTTTTNLINNGSFEVNVNGWVAKGASTVARSTQKFIGDASMVVTTTAVANQGASFPLTLSPNTAYTLRFNVRQATGSHSVAISFGRQDNGSDIDCNSGTLLDGTWRQYVCTFTTGSTISGSNIYIKQTDAVARTIYIDGVQLTLTNNGAMLSGAIQLNGVVTSPVIFRNQSNSTNAFDIQQSDGTAFIGANTAAKILNINGSIGLGAGLSGMITKMYQFGAAGANQNDVLILTSESGSARVNTTTTPRDSRIIGVAQYGATANITTYVITDGITIVNADATTTPIAIGDQLVTSAAAGRVMVDNNATTGILGYATTALASGTGTVQVKLAIVNGQTNPNFGGNVGVAGALNIQGTAVSVFAGSVQGANATLNNQFVTLGQANGLYALSSGNDYIKNGTTLQTANFNIQSNDPASIGGIVTGAVGQTVDIFRAVKSDGNGVRVTSYGGVGMTAGLTVTNGGNNGTTALFVQTTAPAVMAGIFQGAASQTADILQVRNSTGTVLTAFDKDGKLVFGGDTSLYRSSSSLLRTDNSLYVAGNVSINTSSTAKLGVGTNSTSNVADFYQAGTGGIMSLRNSTGTVVSVGNDGGALFKNSTNSTAAFNIQNAAGSSQFVVDTTNGVIGIGTSTPNTGANVKLDVAGVLRSENYYIAGTSVTTGSYSKGGFAGTGGVAYQDVVILADDGGVTRVMTTTTPRDTRVYGVANTTAASGQGVQAAFAGNTTVNADTAAIAVGDQLVTSSTAGRVTVDNSATTGILGYATTTKAGGANGTVGVRLQIQVGQYAPRFQNAIDSTTAFQIQNAAGSSNLFVADTTNTKIGIGTAPSANAGLLHVGAADATTASSGITFGGQASVNLYRSADNVLKTDAGFYIQGNSHVQGQSAVQGLATFGSGSVTNGQQVTINSTAAATKGLVIKGASGQTANLLELQNSSGNPLFYVSSNGLVNAVDFVSNAGTFRTFGNGASSTGTTAAAFTSGTIYGTGSGTTGAVLLGSGSNDTSGNTGVVSVTSGNALSGSSGRIVIDSGTASATAGTVNVGTSNTSGVTIGRVGTATTVAGDLTVGGTLTANYEDSGANNLVTNGSYETVASWPTNQATLTQSTENVFGSYSFKINNPTGVVTGGSYMYQNLPANSATFANKSFTVSYYAKADSTASVPRVRLVTVNGSNIGAACGGIGSSVSITTSWQRFQYSCSWPDVIDATTIRAVVYGHQGNSTNNVYYDGIQVQNGSSANLNVSGTLNVGTGSGVVATFSGSVQGADAVANNQFVTLGQANTNYALATGSNNYIQNGTALQTANFNIQSASASSAGAVIRAAVGQTEDLLQIYDPSGAKKAYFTSTGAFYANNGITVGGSTLTGAATTLNAGSSGNIVLAVRGVSGQTGDLLQVRTATSTVLSISSAGNLVAWNGAGFGGSNVAGTHLTVTSNAAANRGIVVVGASGQTGDLFQVSDNSGNTLAAFSASGQLRIGGATTNTSVLNIGTDTTTAAGGINFGTGSNVNLYRANGAMLRTDAQLYANSGLFYGGASNGYIGTLGNAGNTNSVQLQSGGTTTSGATGNVGVQSGNNSGTGNSGVVTLQSGSAASGSSGNVVIDAGTSSSTAGTISIGATNTSGVTIGRSGVQTTIAGGSSTTGNVGSSGTAAAFYLWNSTADSGAIGKNARAANALNANDVVIHDGTVTGNNMNIDTTVTARDTRIYGVMRNTVAAGSTTGTVVFSGNTTVNATSAAVAIGDQLVTSTEAGKVMVDNSATSGILGFATTAKAAGAAGTVGVRLQVVAGQNAPIFRGNTDSANAFQIQSAGGVSLMNVDSSGGTVTLARTHIDSNNSTAALRVTQIGSGDIAQFKKGSAQVFTINNDGTSVFKSASNSTTAFQIQNASGTSMFTADTTNGRLAVGAGAVAANSALTVGTNTTTAAGGVYFGTDTVLYRASANQLQTTGLIRATSGLVSTIFTSDINATNNVTFRSGGFDTGTGNTGSATFMSGNNTVTGNTGAVVLQSGNATSGNSGNILIDAGTASGTTGTISIGTASTSGITIGRVGVVATVAGGLTVTGNIVSNGGLQVNGAALFAAMAITDKPTGGDIAATVEGKVTYNVNQSTAGQALTLPTPTNPAAGRIIYINNVGTVSFTMHGGTVVPGQTASYMWNGTAWSLVAGGGDSNAFIQNGTALQTANFNIQSASATSVGATIRAATGQSVNLLEIQDSSGNAQLRATAAGSMFASGYVTSGSQSPVTNSTGGSAQLSSVVATADRSGLVVRAASSQTANLIEVLDSSSNLLTAVSASGQLKVAGATTYNGALNVGTNTTTAAGGIYFGTDTYLYREGPANLRTNGNMIANTFVSGSGNYITYSNVTTSSGTSAATLQSGGVSGAASGTTGAAALKSGNNTSSGDTGAITLQSGNATNGNSGNINMDVGTASGVSGTINVGTANTSGITIGRTGVLTSIAGNANIAGTLSVAGATTVNTNSATAFKVEQTGVNNNTFVVDTTNGKVGIGMTPLTTSSPALQVNGGISASSTIYAQNGLVLGSASLTNNSSALLKPYNITGTVAASDVVVLNSSGLAQTTTTSRDSRVIGVATFIGAGYANVAYHGIAVVNATADAVAIGDQLVTSAEAGKVAVDNNATSGIIGYATTTKAAGAAGTIGVRLQIVSGQAKPNFAGAITVQGTDTSVFGGTVQGADATANNQFATLGQVNAAASSTNFVQNGTEQQIGNFNIQSANATSIGAIVRGAASQSVDIFKVGAAGGSDYLWINSTGYLTANRGSLIRASGTASNALVVQGVASQTADLLQVKDSADAVLSAISATGQLKVASAAAFTGALNVGTNTTAAAGGIYFGTDTNLYRSAADTLKTDDIFNAGAGLQVNNTTRISSTGAFTAVGIANSGAYTQTGTSANTLSGALTVAGFTTFNGGATVNRTYNSTNAGEQINTTIAATFSVADTGLKQNLRLNNAATHTTGTIVDFIGSLSLNSINGNGGTVTNATNYWARADTATGATTTNSRGLYVINGTGAGTLQNQYGVYVDALTKGTVSNYAVYTAGTTASYFGGAVTGGSFLTAGNITQSSAGALTTGTGAVTLNGATSVSGTNTFTVGTGATALGGTLTVAGAATINNNLSVTGGLNVKGYQTSSTSSTLSGQYTRLASCSLTAQYQDCRTSANIATWQDGGSIDRATIDIRVKQQNVMGAVPYINIQMYNNTGIVASNIVAVTTVNTAGSTVVEIYGQVNGSFKQWAVAPLINVGSNPITWQSTQGFTAALPAGTQTVGSYAEVNATTVNAYGNVNILNSAVATFGSTTGDKIQLYNNTYGLGIENNALTNWSGNSFRWRVGGTSVSTGTEAMTLSSAGVLNVTGGLQTGGTTRIGSTGALSNITDYSQAGGNFGITGTGTFSTGTGAVTVNGAASLTSTLNVSGAAQLTNTLSVNGSTTLRNTVNSTTAFNVQNSSSVTLLGVDTTNGKIFSDIADGASAAGFTLNTTNSYTTAGAKLLSVQNGGVEKFAVDKDGKITTASVGVEALNIPAAGSWTATNANTWSVPYVWGAEEFNTRSDILSRTSAFGFTDGGIAINKAGYYRYDASVSVNPNGAADGATQVCAQTYTSLGANIINKCTSQRITGGVGTTHNISGVIKVDATGTMFTVLFSAGPSGSLTDNAATMSNLSLSYIGSL